MAHSLGQICRIFPLDQTEFCSQVSEIISSVNVSNRLCKDGLLIITQLVWILILPTPLDLRICGYFILSLGIVYYIVARVVGDWLGRT